MNLEDHPGAEAFLLKALLHPNHCKLYYIGRCSLDGGIDRIPFCQGSDVAVPGIDVREIPAPSEQRLNIAVLPGKIHIPADEVLYRGETFKIPVDKGLRLFPAHPKPLSQAEGGNAVHYAEVGRLGLTALLPCHLFHRDSEYLRRRCRMHVLSASEGRCQMRIPAQVSHDTKLYLRVVCRNYDSLRSARDESLADFLAAFCADGNILQVRIGTGKPSRCRKRLVERRMHTAVNGRNV